MIVAIFSLTLASSRALFVDSVEVDENYFEAGNVDISATPVNTAVTMTNMKPGDSTSGVITVSNSGSLDFNYDLAAKKDGGISEFYNVLTAKVEKDTEVLFDGPIKDLLNLTSGRRILAPGTSEDLKITIGLPEDVASSMAKKYTTAAFVFSAEQL